MSVCCLYFFEAVIFLLLAKYFQDKEAKKYLTGEYFYSSDVLKSQIKVLLKDYGSQAKFVLNSYFFMIFGVFIVTLFMYFMHQKFYWYQTCHFHKIFIIVFGLIVFFIGVQFYLEYYKFILPVAEEAVVYADIRKKANEPVSLSYAIDRAIETKEEHIELIPLKKFLKIYDNFIYYHAGLTPLTNDDIKYFKEHSALAGFIYNPDYSIYYMQNERKIPGKDESKLYFLQTRDGNLKALLITKSKFEPFLNMVNNDFKQQLINLGDAFVASLILFFALC